MRAAALALCLAGCVPLYVEPDLQPVAEREWSRLSPLAVEWTVYRCIGSPGYALVADESGARGVMFLPTWPLSWGRSCERAWMRYEMAKAAHVLHAGSWWPLAAIDSLLHLPPSELRSWWAVVAAPAPK